MDNFLKDVITTEEADELQELLDLGELLTLEESEALETYNYWATVFSMEEDYARDNYWD